MDSSRWKQIETLYHAALEKPTEERSAFLTDACAEDPELRREVDSLLATDGSSQGPIDRPAWDGREGLLERDPSVELLPGSLIGAYRIEALLAKGGMGTVYRATDTKLNRAVAIKVLSDELADAEARRRFQREAQTASGLNHPHILTVYDVGEHQGRQYIVTEFVDGGTLKDWARGNRTWRQAVQLLAGVADGLAAAHAAGILHRDIKPANILVAKNGYAKLADFGLAKLQQPTPAGDETRTQVEGQTHPGMILGTIAYMSPEQAAGRPLDARSDIFSFGAMLYETLGGRKPFSGASDLELLKNVIHALPQPLGDEIPFQARLIVEKSLEKDPAERYQSVREVVVDLRRLIRSANEDAAKPASNVGPQRRVWPWAAGLLLVALAGGVAAGRWWLAKPVAADVSRFVQLTEFLGLEEQGAISPDGKTLAFVYPKDGHRQIWIRPLTARGSPYLLTSDDHDHEHPRWAGDSGSLIYFSGAAKEGELGTIYEVPASPGIPPRPIGAALSYGDPNKKDGRIAAFRRDGNNAVLTIIGAGDRSKVRELHRWTLGAFDGGYSDPRWSPDNRSIAFVQQVSFTVAKLLVIDASGGEPKEVAIAKGIQGIAWLPDGSGLVYASADGSTMAYPPIYSLRKVTRNGTPMGRLTSGDVSYVDPDIVEAGKLFATVVRMKSDIWRFPVTESATDDVSKGFNITRQTGQVQTPTASPNGEEVAYLSNAGGHSNVWAIRVDGKSPARQLTFETDPLVVIGVPRWSPTGDWIVFIRTEGGEPAGEYVVNPKDGGLPVRLVSGGTASAGWAEKGQWLYYAGEVPGGCHGVYKVPIGGGSPALVRCNVASFEVSANGSSIFYSPTLDTQAEIWKGQPGDAPGKLLFSLQHSRIPLWPHQYVISPDEKWLAAPLRDAGTTNIWRFSTADGSMQKIVDFGERSTLIGRQVAWSPDGQSIFAAVIDRDSDIVLLDGARQ